MDIDVGKIKVKFGGSSAGHNGIESIDKNIGKNYSRIRIGIGQGAKNDSTVCRTCFRQLSQTTKKQEHDRSS